MHGQGAHHVRVRVMQTHGVTEPQRYSKPKPTQTPPGPLPPPHVCRSAPPPWQCAIILHLDSHRPLHAPSPFFTWARRRDPGRRHSQRDSDHDHDRQASVCTRFFPVSAPPARARIPSPPLHPPPALSLPLTPCTNPLILNARLLLSLLHAFISSWQPRP